MSSAPTFAAPASFWRLAAEPARRNTLLAASLGWMLDSMDVMLYSMVLPVVARDLHMSAAAAGGIISATLVTAAFGGIAFGFVADRFGRTRALTASILIYCLATGLCAFVRTPVQLALCRMLLGLGMGGEWAAGAALVAESWPDEHRAKALSIVQSSWAVGYALAAALVALIMPHFGPHRGWRMVFLAGMLPALTTLWMRRNVREPESWRREAAHPPTPAVTLFRKPLRRSTVIITAVNAASLFAWWGLFSWMPAFLSLPVSKGGHGLDILHTASWTILMQTGTFAGYLSFGPLADRFGRKRVYITYLLIAACLVPGYALAVTPLSLLLLGPFVGFFGSGFFSGFSILASEAFPTALRGRGMGLAYNLGRIVSAAAPYTIGRLSETRGLGPALLLTAGGFLFAAVIASALQPRFHVVPCPVYPDTKPHSSQPL